MKRARAASASPEDARVTPSAGETCAGGEASRAELLEPGIGISEDQVRDVAAEPRGQLEAVTAGPGVDEDAVGDLADDRLPVRTDVVQAGPAAARLDLLEAGRRRMTLVASSSLSSSSRRSSMASGSSIVGDGVSGPTMKWSERSGLA